MANWLIFLCCSSIQLGYLCKHICKYICKYIRKLTENSSGVGEKYG